MSIKIAFYKGEGRLFDKLIRWWTKSDYSHCELVVNGVAYSSSTRDGGVRAVVIDWNADHWDFMELDEAVMGRSNNQVVDWFRDHYRQKYDYLGLVWFVLPILPWGRPDRWFCSEACADALGIANPSTFSPKDLYHHLRGLSTAGVPVAAV